MYWPIYGNGKQSAPPLTRGSELKQSTPPVHTHAAASFGSQTAAWSLNLLLFVNDPYCRKAGLVNSSNKPIRIQLLPKMISVSFDPKSRVGIHALHDGPDEKAKPVGKKIRRCYRIFIRLLREALYESATGTGFPLITSDPSWMVSILLIATI